MKRMGGDPRKINPLLPGELVIDHSVQVDQLRHAGCARASTPSSNSSATRSATRSCAGARRRFDNFKVVPPETGIVHQVNLEYLARVVFDGDEDGAPVAYPDTLVGTDRHTTMVNGLGVLGWGVGGIEAEAAMLGQPVSMLIPQVVGFKLVRHSLPEGATATDLVLTVTQMLRKKGVVGKFVEFFGAGLVEPAARRPRHHRATWRPNTARRAASSRSTRRRSIYLRFTGRSAGRRSQLVEAYAKEQGMFRTGVSAGCRLFRHAGAGSRHGRAEPRRPEAAAGSRAADGRRSESCYEALAGAEGRRRARRSSRARTERGTSARRGTDGGDRQRCGRHRRDHELHEHVEPLGDDRAPGCSRRKRSSAASTPSRG